jgi:Ca-activated chloride channel family protein
VQITRPSDRSAVVKMELRDSTATDDFRLIYNLDDRKVGATLLSWRPDEKEDGYFLLLASPGFAQPDEKPAAKTVVFVIDKSGSMSGKKIAQARDAARFVLNTLNEGDTFNLIAYDDMVNVFQPELQKYDDTTRTQAAAFIDNLRDGGSTNIDQALRAALEMIQDDTKPAYVLFLTDGLPTAGEQNEIKIAANAKKANQAGARVVVFGVGYDVNSRLLDRISGDNGGVSEYVKPEDNLEAAVSRFASRLTSPVLAGIEVAFDGIQANRAYPRQLTDLFEGGQLVWVGRYAKSGQTTVKITGNIAGKSQTFTYPVALAGPGEGSAYQFVERLWAMRRVGDLIDQIDLNGKSDELVNELVALSTKYGILTPYTSFLADETVALGRDRENAERAKDNLSALEQTSGQSALAQRAAKSDYKMAEQAAPSSAPVMADSLSGEKQQVASVRNVGDRTFFRKAGRWVQSDLSEAQQKNVKVITQYSDEYFELSRQLTPSENQYLANFTEDVLVELDGKVYEVRQR